MCTWHFDSILANQFGHFSHLRPSYVICFPLLKWGFWQPLTFFFGEVENDSKVTVALVAYGGHLSSHLCHHSTNTRHTHTQPHHLHNNSASRSSTDRKVGDCVPCACACVFLQTVQLCRPFSRPPRVRQYSSESNNSTNEVADVCNTTSTRHVIMLELC